MREAFSGSRSGTRGTFEAGVALPVDAWCFVVWGLQEDHWPSSGAVLVREWVRGPEQDLRNNTLKFILVNLRT
jgi:hypothetical protein